MIAGTDRIVRSIFCKLLWLIPLVAGPLSAQEMKAHNPIIFADVPDMSIVRVNNSYYMSSTTMHMNPGVPIMKSDDLVNWHLISYAYDTLANTDVTNLVGGKQMYGRGSWASSIRYHNGL